MILKCYVNKQYYTLVYILITLYMAGEWFYQLFHMTNGTKIAYVWCIVAKSYGHVLAYYKLNRYNTSTISRKKILFNYIYFKLNVLHPIVP